MGRQDDPITCSLASNRACRCCNGDVYSSDYVRTDARILHWVLVQTAKGIGDNGIWRIAKLNGILYLTDVGSKTASFSSAFAGIFASN